MLLSPMAGSVAKISYRFLRRKVEHFKLLKIEVDFSDPTASVEEGRAPKA